MQLRIARLCLDCEEVHDAERCPLCASEVFAYLTRWVPAPDGRLRPKPAPSPDYDAYRQLTAAEPAAPGGRLLVRSALGLGAIGLAGWLWGRRPASRPESKPESKLAAPKQ